MLSNKIKTVARGLKVERMEITRLALVYRALVDNRYNRTRTAEALGITVKTVRAAIVRLGKFGIKIPAYEMELYGVRRRKMAEKQKCKWCKGDQFTASEMVETNQGKVCKYCWSDSGKGY